MTPEQFILRALGLDRTPPRPVPFVDLGRDWQGWDCFGMVRLFYRDVLGIDLPAHDMGYETAGDTPEDREAIRCMVMEKRAAWRRVEVPEPGDVPLLICIGRPVHVGVMIDRQRFLHAEKRIGTVVERLTSPIWARRREGVYRYVQA